jgi:flagellar motor protein MotB
VWRYRDANNYYVCRANALENNVVLYKVENGKRKALDIVGRVGGYGVKEPVAAERWHTLRVEFAGTRFKVIFNGKTLFEVEDATFSEAGLVGVWTKADSVTRFDDFAFGPR